MFPPEITRFFRQNPHPPAISGPTSGPTRLRQGVLQLQTELLRVQHILGRSLEANQAPHQHLAIVVETHLLRKTASGSVVKIIRENMGFNMGKSWNICEHMG